MNLAVALSFLLLVAALIYSIRLAIRFRDGRLVAATGMFFCMAALRAYELAARSPRGFVWFETFGDMIIVGLAVAAPLAIVAFGNALSERDLLLNETREAHASRRRLLHRIMAAQEEERRMLSVRIHDLIAQPLIALKLLIENLRYETGESRTQAVDRAVAYLDETADEARTLWLSLSPSALKQFGLSRAIHELAATFHSPQLAVRLEVNALDRCFLEAWDIDIYRLVQEGLTNVVKHTAASEVHIVAHASAEKLTLRIYDNGRGYDLASQAPGLGLSIAAERAAILGGSLDLKSRPEGGMELILEMPVQVRQA